MKNLALMTHITTEVDDYPLIRLATNSGVQDIALVGAKGMNSLGNYIVFLNGRFSSRCMCFVYTAAPSFIGSIIGIVRNYRRLINIFRLMRRKGCISAYVSIYPSHLHRSVYISSDGGRLCRPYIIVEGGVPLVTDKHVAELEKGIRSFEDFLHDGNKVEVE